MSDEDAFPSFETKRDRYDGIVVDLSRRNNKKLFSNPPPTSPTSLTLSDFVDYLSTLVARSLDEWREAGVRGVWFHVPLRWEAAEEMEVEQETSYFSPSFMMPCLSAHKFRFHHARDGISVLTLWLPDPSENPLPEFARCTIGVAGLTVDFDSFPEPRVLLIQERYNRIQKDWWKLPGGSLDPDETLWQAALREVKEETGVDAQFVDMLGFRHLHNFRWSNVDDFYFVCILTPLQTGDVEVTMDPNEISSCEWVPLETWFSWDSTKVGKGENHLIREAFRERVENVKQLVQNPYAIPDISEASLLYPHLGKNRDSTTEESGEVVQHGNEEDGETAGVTAREVIEDVRRGEEGRLPRRRVEAWPIRYTEQLWAHWYQLKD